MNKNTKRKRNAALDSYHRKHKSVDDHVRAQLISNHPRVHKGPKVARSAAAITAFVGRDR